MTTSPKTAGLYIQLAKALNALERAGEDPQAFCWDHAPGVEGISARVTMKDGEWAVVES